jgi:hypothetical protein
MDDGAGDSDGDAGDRRDSDGSDFSFEHVEICPLEAWPCSEMLFQLCLRYFQRHSWACRVICVSSLCPVSGITQVVSGTDKRLKVKLEMYLGHGPGRRRSATRSSTACSSRPTCW